MDERVNRFNIGDLLCDELYIGGIPVNKAYLGDTLMYEMEELHSPAASIEKSSISYDTEEIKEFSGEDDFIDTGVDLFDAGQNWSILIDFTDEGKSEPSNSLFILHNFYEGPNGELQGFNIQKTGDAQGNRLAFQVNDHFYATKTLSTGVNTRLVITFTYPDKLDMYYNDPDIDAAIGGDSHYQFNFGQYVDISGCNLHLACWYNESQGGTGRFWRGQINEFIIWEGKVLDQIQINYILNNKQ